ncbi:MAG: fructose-6-phosphate aldolase [Dehalococcoidia bacterium]|nr:fructose-6-phosphate aldolase [Dehalococcoidia bacterium]
MEIFIDTANIDEIKKYSKFGIIDGVTTNPALIAKEGKNFKDVLVEICDIVDGPISAEVVSTDTENMIREGRLINQLHKNIVVKLPSIPEGFEALNVLSSDGIKTNFTVVYTSNQALLAAKLGATYVSPFVGRLDVNSTSGSDLISEIVCMYENYNFDTKVLAASMRNSIYVKDAALAGAHVATIPPEILDQMMNSELSNIALEGFLDEWKKLPKEKRNYFE